MSEQNYQIVMHTPLGLRYGSMCCRYRRKHGGDHQPHGAYTALSRHDCRRRELPDRGEDRHPDATDFLLWQRQNNRGYPALVHTGRTKILQHQRFPLRPGGEAMRNFYTLVVRRRWIIIAAFILAAAVCLFLNQLVAVNYDMTDYLPRIPPQPSPWMSCSRNLMAGFRTPGSWCGT